MCQTGPMSTAARVNNQLEVITEHVQPTAQAGLLELTNRFSEDPCARNGPKSTAARVNKQLEVNTVDVQLIVQG